MKNTLFHQRAAALKIFNAWEQAHPQNHDFQTALDGLETILSLLPESSKTRSWKPEGIISMHKALAHLQ